MLFNETPEWKEGMAKIEQMKADLPKICEHGRLADVSCWECDDCHDGDHEFTGPTYHELRDENAKLREENERLLRSHESINREQNLLIEWNHRVTKDNARLRGASYNAGGLSGTRDALTASSEDK